MVHVPPGCRTGLYYIPLAGLAWDITYHDLKDFLRGGSQGSSIEVDWAETYKHESKGMGWVRFRDLTSFRRAYSLLNGASIKGHPVIADDRNETMEVVLFDIPEHSTSDTNVRPEGQSQNSSLVVPSYSVHQGHSEWPQYDLQTPLGNLTPLSPLYLTGTPFLPVSPSSSAYTFQQPTGYFLPVDNVTQFVQEYTPQFRSPPLSSQAIAEEFYLSQPSAIVKTEARKVIFTHLSRTAIEREIHIILRKFLHVIQYPSASESPVQSVDLPRHSDGSLKGHALVVLNTHELAKILVTTLDGKSHQGRTLHVRLAKEGAEPSGQLPSSKPLGLIPSSLSHQCPLESLSKASMNRPGRKQSIYKGTSGKEHARSSTTGRSHSKQTKGIERERAANHLSDRQLFCGTPMVADGTGT